MMSENVYTKSMKAREARAELINDHKFKEMNWTSDIKGRFSEVSLITFNDPYSSLRSNVHDAFLQVSVSVCVYISVCFDLSALGPIRVTVAMIGKFAISVSFANVYVLTAEIFPTPLR